MTIYIDMDGVICKWCSDATFSDTLKPGFFLKRKPEMKMIYLVKCLKALGFNVCILSAAYQNGYAEKEKSDWIDRFLDKTIDRIFVPYGECKSDYISMAEDSVLIDDFTKNLVDWEKQGLKGVKFYNGINGTKGTWRGSSIDLSMSIGDMLKVII